MSIRERTTWLGSARHGAYVGWPALTNDMGPDSDIDFLVDFEPGERWSLMALARAEEEFAAVFGRPVDLVDRASLVLSSNWLRRDSILDSAKVVYGS